MSDEYTIALGLHQAGRFADAAQWYRTLLAREPDHVDALHMLGVLHHQIGEHDRAVELIERALRHRPQFAEAWGNLALAYRKLDKLDEALSACRTAVAQAPNLATVRANLARLLLDRGQFEEALPHCQEAVRLDLDRPTVHVNLGDAYRNLRRWNDAEAAFRRAIQLAPALSRAHTGLGKVLWSQGRVREAIGSYQRAVELAPDDVSSWLLLAGAYFQDDDFSAAIPCYRRIVALEPAQASGLVSLGLAFQEDGQANEAAACYQKALELQPGHEWARVYLGGLHRTRGEFAEAEACHRQAAADHPGAAAPLVALASLLRDRLPAADRQAIVERLNSPEVPDEQRQELLFGMAQVLDSSGNYAEAAECLKQANRCDLERQRTQGQGYDPDDFRHFVDLLIAQFTPEFFGSFSEPTAETRLPIFVFGLPRSGTTLVEQVLASHSRVHGAGELHLVRHVIQSAPPLEQPLDVRAAIQDMSGRYLQRLQEIMRRDCPGSAPERVVDKLPDNYLYLGFLALMFPRATFIHVRRDLRDVAVSCWMTNFTNIRWASDLDHLAERIREYRRVMTHWRAVLPVPIHEVVYERLVEDFETEARRLIAACGLEWEPACLEFHKTRRSVRTASATQVRQPLYRRAVARWKHYEPYLADLFARLPSD